jgi:hypothetical protein
MQDVTQKIAHKQVHDFAFANVLSGKVNQDQLQASGATTGPATLNQSMQRDERADRDTQNNKSKGID